MLNISNIFHGDLDNELERLIVKMGRWGYMPFENDVAADFSSDLDKVPQSQRLSLLEEAFVKVIECTGHLEGSSVDAAIAAASLAARDLPGGDEFRSEVVCPKEGVPPAPNALICAAIKAVDIVIDGDNDLKEDLGKSVDGGRWCAMLERLRMVLAKQYPSPQGYLW
jgi:hypothetical protein